MTSSPAALAPCQRGQRLGGGDLVGVVAHARHLHQRKVALQPHPLRHGRDAGMPRSEANLPLVAEAPKKGPDPADGP